MHSVFLRAAALTALLLIAHGSSLMGSDQPALGLGQDTQDLSTLLELRDIAAPDNLTGAGMQSESTAQVNSGSEISLGPGATAQNEGAPQDFVSGSEEPEVTEIHALAETEMGPSNDDGDTREINQSTTTLVQLAEPLQDVLDVDEEMDTELAEQAGNADANPAVDHAKAIQMLVADRDKAVAEFEAADRALPVMIKAYDDAIEALRVAKNRHDTSAARANQKSSEAQEYDSNCKQNLALNAKEITIVNTLINHIAQLEAAGQNGGEEADVQLQRLSMTAKLLLDQSDNEHVKNTVTDIAENKKPHTEVTKIKGLLQDLLTKLGDKSCLEESKKKKEEAQKWGVQAQEDKDKFEAASKTEALAKEKKNEAQQQFDSKKELRDKLNSAMKEVRKELGHAACGKEDHERFIPGTDKPKPEGWDREANFFKNHDFKPTCAPCNEQGLKNKVRYWEDRTKDLEAKLAPHKIAQIPPKDWRPTVTDEFQKARLQNKDKIQHANEDGKTTYENYNWYRLKVNGKMTAANVLKTCTEAGLQTPCDHASYNDGKCVQIPHSGHFSHNNHHKMNRKVVQNVFFYTTHQGNTLQNTGTSHRWAAATDANGDTLCVLPAPYTKVAFDWNGFRFFKLNMKGDVSSAKIKATCDAYKLMTPCGHASYGAQGGCQIVYHAGHMSYNPHLTNAKDHKSGSKFDMASVPYTYWYAGNANLGRSLQNWHGTHRWNIDHERDGQQYCIAPLAKPDPKKVVATWNGWDFHKVRVEGGMNSGNIANACQNALSKDEYINGHPLLPVCGHNSYADGKCVVVDYKGHMSYNPHHNFPRDVIERTYWYAGSANGGNSLQNIAGTHRWSTKGDLVGDVLCVSVRPQPKKEVTMIINGWKFYKRRVEGEVNSANIRKACEGMGKENNDPFMVPCDHPAYGKDGECAVVRRRSLHFSHNSHNLDKDGKGFGDLLSGTFWFAGKANMGKALLNWKGSHRWSSKGDMFGMTFCVLPPKKPPTPLPLSAVWGPGAHKYSFRMVRVPGQMNSQAILNACTSAGMDTPCDHASYADGRCRVVLKKGHMSHNSHHDFPRDVIARTYWYASKANSGKALQNWRDSHRWSTTGDFYGYTLCIDKLKRKECSKVKPSFTRLGWSFYKVHTHGQVNSASIIKACADFTKCRTAIDKGDGPYLVPCDHPSYRDGNCVVIRERSRHWSHNKYNDIKPELIDNTYWYAGNANNNLALENWRGTHRWSGKSDIDGAVFCAKPPAPEVKETVWRGYTFVRLQVKGQISNEAIHATCKLNGLKTPCDHQAYADGKCIALFKKGHLSHNPHHDFPRDFIDRTYWYTGSRQPFAKTALGHRPLQNWRGTHRWAIEGDMYENAWCMKMPPKANACAMYGKHCPLSFSYNKWEFYRTRTEGEVNSASIIAACKAIKMMVPCGHPSYADGNCVSVRKQSLHWSYAKHNPATIQPKLEHSYWYAGDANGNKALENWRGTHRWSGKGDRFGPVFCVKPPAAPAATPFTWKHHNFVRVQVKGQINSEAIHKACTDKGYTVPCGHVSYADGKCTNVLKSGHMSYNQHHDLPRDLVNRLYFYSGSANGGKSLQNWRNTHRWSKIGDMYENTLCIKEPSDDTKCAAYGQKCDRLFSLNGWGFYKTRTKGPVTAASIRDACKAVGLQVPCGHPSYADGHCVAVQKRSRHLSYNAHNKDWFDSKPAAEVARIKKGLRGTFWYTGPHHTGALENWTQQSGSETHRWAKKGDRDAMTFCVKAPRKPEAAATLVWRGYEFVKVRVEGQMSSKAILEACQANKYLTPCNHKSYADGKCINVLKSGHLSYNNHHDMDAANGAKFIDRTYTYCGAANNGAALQNWRNTHRWSKTGDMDGNALCVKKVPYPCAKPDGREACKSEFEVHGWKFHRTRVAGEVTSDSIRSACSKLNMKPPCDHISYSDGHCVNVRKESGHWSHNRYLGDRFAALKKFLDHTFWYAGNANNKKALENWRGSHRWSEAGDLYGMTWCVTPPDAPKDVEYKWKHWKFKKVRVPGQITSAKIYDACTARGFKTPCDHTSYADGKCVGVIHGRHISHNTHHDMSTQFLSRTYTYCGGANGGRALMNWHRYGTQWSHRWSRTGDVEENALCISGYTTPDCAAYGKHCPEDKSKSFFPTDFKITFGWRFFLTRTNGAVNSGSIEAACKKIGMMVPCDHISYGANGGDCVNVRKYGHWSHNQYNQGESARLIKSVDLDRTYWYAGKANGDRALENTGASHRWTTPADKDGKTFCVLPPSPPSAEIYTWNGRKYRKVQVQGQISSKKIYDACKAAGLKVPCDHPSYNDGKCTVVNSKGHMSHNRYHNFDRQKIDMTFWYAGNAHGGRALQNYNGSHRWSTLGDKFGETWCLV